MNDLVFNRMLATAVDNTKDVRGSLDQMGEVIEKVFHDVSIDTAERAWAHLYATYRAIMEDMGDNSFDRPHSGVRKRQNSGGLVYDVTINNDHKLMCKDYFDVITTTNQLRHFNLKNFVLTKLAV